MKKILFCRIISEQCQKLFYVRDEKNFQHDDWFLKKGSKVTVVKVIAQGEKIRDVKSLVRGYLKPDETYN